MSCVLCLGNKDGDSASMMLGRCGDGVGCGEQEWSEEMKPPVEPTLNFSFVGECQPGFKKQDGAEAGGLIKAS